MRILYLHQYFTTPRGSSGTRSYEFARRWVLLGHQVTMLTTTAQLVGSDIEGIKGRFFKRFQIEGIDVLALCVSYNQKMSIGLRQLSFLRFSLLSSLIVLFIKRPDIIYATSTPLTVGVPALIGRWFRNIRFIIEVRDQWPEIPIELGIIKNCLLKRLLLGLERLIYRGSSAIVVLSPGMAAGVREVIGDSRGITVVPNCCDVEIFHPDVDGEGIRKEYGWCDKLVFLHAGAMGKVNNLKFVLDAADRLRDCGDVHFVLIGKGSQKLALEARVLDLGLRNVDILEGVSRDRLVKFFAAADVGLVIIGNYPIIEHNSANKFFDSLSMGKCVLLNYSGWQRDIIEKWDAGFGCRLCDLDEFIEKVCYLQKHRDEVKKKGFQSRKIAEEQFNRDDLAIQCLNVITSVRERKR